jgi:hypothetical protein
MNWKLDWDEKDVNEMNELKRMTVCAGLGLIWMLSNNKNEMKKKIIIKKMKNMYFFGFLSDVKIINK